MSLGCEGVARSNHITSHRTVSQSPGSPVTRYPIPGTCCIYCILYIQHAYPSRSPGPEVCIPGCTRCSARLLLLLPNFAQWGSHLSVLTYTISTSMLHERLTYVLNFLKLCFWQCTDREGGVGGKCTCTCFDGEHAARPGCAVRGCAS